MMGYLFVGLTLATGQVDAGNAPGPGATLAAPRRVPLAQIGAPTSSPSGDNPIYLIQGQKTPPMEVLPVAPDAGKDKSASAANGEKNGNGKDKDKDNGEKKPKEPEDLGSGGFLCRFVRAYCNEFKKKDDSNGDDEPTPERRALPEPWSSPPFPGHEYQGYPLVGVPKSTDVYPFMKAVYSSPWGDAIKDSGIKFYGWVTGSGNWSTAHNSNAPTSYWVIPNRYELDQAVFRFEREMDTVQRDHIDWGFRSTAIYGIDYRYTTAGGWGSDQLLHHNLQNGWDPIEQYIDVYIPWVAEGMVIRAGRWVACPDIETQLAPDNYLGSHSILFTYDTYTQTGAMLTFRTSEQWMFQVGINAGNDMAPWYQGAVPCGFFAVRWVSKDNNDAFYTCLNQINGASFRHFNDWGLNQPAGHDNFNYVVSTWEHRFTKEIHTKTEAYYMWEQDAEVGGTPSLGPVKPIGGGGGDGTLIPGWSHAYGILNYSMFAVNKSDYVTVRNEWYHDSTGFRTGVRGDYTSHTIGYSHQFNSLLMLRPEVGYYRNWSNQAFDNGTKNGIWLYGFDVTWRF